VLWNKASFLFTWFFFLILEVSGHDIESGDLPHETCCFYCACLEFQQFCRKLFFFTRTVWTCAGLRNCNGGFSRNSRVFILVYVISNFYISAKWKKIKNRLLNDSRAAFSYLINRFLLTFPVTTSEFLLRLRTMIFVQLKKFTIITNHSSAIT
jgi:hypothetical protein